MSTEAEMTPAEAEFTAFVCSLDAPVIEVDIAIRAARDMALARADRINSEAFINGHAQIDRDRVARLASEILAKSDADAMASDETETRLEYEAVLSH